MTTHPIAPYKPGGGGRTRARRDPIRIRASSPTGPELPARSRARPGCRTIASLVAEKSIDQDPDRRETFSPSDDALLFKRRLHLGEIGLDPCETFRRCSPSDLSAAPGSPLSSHPVCLASGPASGSFCRSLVNLLSILLPTRSNPFLVMSSSSLRYLSSPPAKIRDPIIFFLGHDLNPAVGKGHDQPFDPQVFGYRDDLGSVSISDRIEMGAAITFLTAPNRAILFLFSRKKSRGEGSCSDSAAPISRRHRVGADAPESQGTGRVL